MALLFFGGVMNLYWIVGLAVFVLLEKAIPMGHWLARVAGIALVTWGVTFGRSAAACFSERRCRRRREQLRVLQESSPTHTCP